MAEKIRVLYVDDEPSLLDLGKLFLERSGDFTVTIASSAPEAIRILGQERFDTIVSDYQMPEMDGIEFLKHLKSEGNTTPFIIFTGKGREEVVIEALNAGADGYLQKGGESKSQFAELSHKIKQAASRKRAEDSLRTSEEKYRHLIEHSDEAIVVVQDEMLRLVNHQAVELTGYSEQELLSMPFPTFIHPDDRTKVVEWYQKRMKGENPPSRYTFRSSSKDGSTRWVEISVVAIDWEGQPATLNFLTDITERKRAEEVLRKSEERFYQLTEQSNIIAWEVDTRGLYTYVSHVSEAVLGYRPDELVGRMHFYDLHPESGREAFKTASLAVFERKEPFRNLENAIQARDGREVWVSTNGIPLLNGDGTQRGYQGSDTDITERKQAEEALNDSERRVKDIISSLPDATLVIDKNGTVLAWNRAMEDMTGVPAQQMIGKANYEYALPFYHERRPITADLILQEDPAVIAKYPVMQKEGRSRRSEIFIPHLNTGRGAYLWFTASPLYDTSGNLTGAIESIRDITDRKQAEEALKESEERYRTIIDTAQEGIWTLDTNFHINYINEKMAGMLGYTQNEMIGRSFTEFIPEDEFSHANMQVELRRKGARETYERRFLHRNNDILTMLTSSSTIYRPEGIFSGSLAMFTNITERKQAEDALRHVNRQLTLLSSITRHDILNQLMVLKGHLELSRDVLNNPERLSEFLEKEEDAAHNIEDLILFTKEYHDLGVKKPEWQNVDTSIAHAKTNLPLEGITVETESSTLEVFADPLFERVFYNLIDNAIRYGGDEMSRIRLSSQESDTGLILVCEDNGAGVPAGQKKAIFNRGYYQHTGFGLYLSREILAITGITITENGVPGKGARFEITVPKGMWRMKDVNQ